MSEQSPSATDLVAEILARLPALDTGRRQMFLRWLEAHHSGDGLTDANLEDCLTDWFGTLPDEGRKWESHLILNEIAWWRDLDEGSLAELVCSERALDLQRHVRDDGSNE